MLVGGAGLSYEEVASALKCSVGTIKSRVSRARETLRRNLLEEETPSERREAARKAAADGEPDVPAAQEPEREAFALHAN